MVCLSHTSPEQADSHALPQLSTHPGPTHLGAWTHTHTHTQYSCSCMRLPLSGRGASGYPEKSRWSSRPGIFFYLWKYKCRCHQVKTVCACVLSCVHLLATPWTEAPGSSVRGLSQARKLKCCHALLQGIFFPSPGIEPASPVSPAMAGEFFTTWPIAEDSFDIHNPRGFTLSPLELRFAPSCPWYLWVVFCKVLGSHFWVWFGFSPVPSPPEERKYKCHLCPYAAKCRANLNQHLTVHSVKLVSTDAEDIVSAVTSEGSDGKKHPYYYRWAASGACWSGLPRLSRTLPEHLLGHRWRSVSSQPQGWASFSYRLCLGWTLCDANSSAGLGARGELVRREMVMEVALWGGVQREEGSGLLARRSLQLGSSRLYHWATHCFLRIILRKKWVWEPWANSPGSISSFPFAVLSFRTWRCLFLFHIQPWISIWCGCCLQPESSGLRVYRHTSSAISWPGCPASLCPKESVRWCRASGICNF